MRLNPNCIRDILLTLEDVLPPNVLSTFTAEPGRTAYEGMREYPSLSSYSADEIEYHLHQCDESGLLTGARFGLDGWFEIRDLSPAGHEFLASIREPSVWKKIISKIKPGATVGVRSLWQIALAVAEEGIKHGLNLT